MFGTVTQLSCFLFHQRLERIFKVTKTFTNCSLEQTGTNYEQKPVFPGNPEQDIWIKVKKLAKVGHY